jgi:DnaJ-domain-containing protein 1
MSFRQIFDRISRIARAEAGSRRESAFESEFERELRRAQELIDASRAGRRSDVEPDVEPDSDVELNDGPADERADSERDDPEYREACDTLGIAHGATREQVVAAYRRLARSMHPDRVAHLPPEQQHEAHVRMQRINRAYAYLERRTRGS